MRLIFLHGPPAVGKLTVGRELADRTGYHLFHNHLTVDLALAVYEFGTPGFIALREQIWFAVFRRTLADGLPGLIFTFSPEDTVPQRFIDELFSEVAAGGGELVLVELMADEAEIERRIGSDSRRANGKLVDVDLYRKLRAAGRFSRPRLPPPHLQVNTGTMPARQAADLIASFLG